MTRIALLITVLPAVLVAASPSPSAAQGTTSPQQSITLTPCRPVGAQEELLCGAHEVFENRARKAGRRITLDIVVIPPSNPGAAGEPVFYLAGGPGQSAASAAPAFARSGVRRDRPLVLVEQRGTNAVSGLQCPQVGSDDDLQTYFESVVAPAAIRRCRAALVQRTDPSQYGTENVIEDLEEVRRGLGYAKINLWGISGGTRTAYFYLAMHPEAIRAVAMSGVVAPEFRNPLPHARSAQDAIDRLFLACAQETACATTFPNLPAKLDTVLARLGRQPARAPVRHPTTGVESTITFDRDAFADGLRTMLYASDQARFIPAVIARAYDGDFGSAAGFALARARGLRGGIAIGVLLQIVCAEDVSRITPGDIDAATRGTFIGRARVETQMAACREWPTTPVERVRRPMHSSVPVLMVSGDYDPVTPAQWADSAARHFDHSLRVHQAAGHGGANVCVDGLLVRFFAAGTTDGLDTSCLAAVRLPPFATAADLERIFPTSR